MTPNDGADLEVPVCRFDAELGQPSKIAFLSDYLPRRCGIATFTHDLRDAVAAQHPGAECGVVAVNDLPEGYDYTPEVRLRLRSSACATIGRRRISFGLTAST